MPLRYIARAHEQYRPVDEFGRGGRFAALEEPDLLVAHIRTFFWKLPERTQPDAPIATALGLGIG